MCIRDRLIRQWREREEVKQQETEQLISELGQIKDDNDKFKRAMKELDRKNQLIRTLKGTVEGSKMAEKQLIEENRSLHEKLKIFKAEIGQKEAALRAFREKTLSNNEQVASNKEIPKPLNPEHTDRVKTLQGYEEANKQLHTIVSNAIHNLSMDISKLKRQIKDHESQEKELVEEESMAKYVEIPEDIEELEQLYERLMQEKDELEAINNDHC
eukprot:TRINITY_DN7013_c0_g1_i2.p1 TRINITY_DN7013_c0_g1~~TRINITY_DN7013_c0_g1_i2.p1  ORF type:complete len:214 (+),score=55.33 TRINITY_DN7013_c0_g1_i2:67-708(+)